MDKKWTGYWISDQQFVDKPKLHLFHKEMTDTSAYHHEEALKNRHMLVRKTVEINQVGKEAWIDITADDYYKLYVNGQLVGQGPAQSSYDHYYYNRFLVTPYLKTGNNVIAVHVYYQGLVCRAYNSGDYRQGMIAELEMDGHIIAYSNQTWLYRIAEQYSSGGIVGYNTQYLEAIDNRKKQADWLDEEINELDWQACAEVLLHDYQFFLQPTPPVSVYKMAPTQIISLPEGGYWIDFGSEVTGQLQLRANGQAGDIVEIRCGEELLESNGSVQDWQWDKQSTVVTKVTDQSVLLAAIPSRVRYNMRCNCEYREIWTLSGAMDEPDFYDYKAFRYAEIIAPASVDIDIDSIHAIVRHYPLDEQACQFSSSDAMLNQIWSICRKGVQWGSQENYVDCPSREKGQYLGDNTIITHTHTYISGDLRLFRKSLLDFRNYANKVCYGLTAVAPGHHMQEIADFSLQWPLQLLQYYRQSGDREFLSEMLPTAEAILNHFRQFEREDGLLQQVADKWNLVDWPEGMRDGYDFPLTLPVGEGCHNVLNAFYYGSWSVVLDIREILTGHEIPSDSDDRVRQEQRREAFRAQFYDEKQQLFKDAMDSTHTSLHANVLPLLFGLADQGNEEEQIVNLIREKRLSCGVYMAYFVLQALAKVEEYDLLYELIVADDVNSWSTMVKEGATTCFEAWSKEAKQNTSLCHPWASAPIPLLIEYIAGIQPAKPGWSEVSFKPQIPADLTELYLAFQTVAGEIILEHNPQYTRLTVPAGVTVHEN